MLGIRHRSRKPLLAAGLSFALAILGPAGPTQAGASMSTGTGTWLWQNPLPQGNPLSGLSCPAVSDCVLVGDAGTTLTTTDGGFSWLSGRSGTGTNLKDVSCPTVMICFSVGEAGVILRSADGGVNWSSQVSGTANHLHGIRCPTVSTCFAVGASATIRSTTNGGATWSAQVSPDPSTPLNAISCATSTACVAVGGGTKAGAIAGFTTDGGVQWVACSPALVNSPESV